MSDIIWGSEDSTSVAGDGGEWGDFQARAEEDAMDSVMKDCNIKLTTEQHEHYARVAALLFASNTIPRPTLDALVVHALSRFEESFIDYLGPELRDLMMGKKYWRW